MDGNEQDRHLRLCAAPKAPSTQRDKDQLRQPMQQHDPVVSRGGREA